MIRRFSALLATAAALLTGTCACGPRTTASLDAFDIALYTPRYAEGFEILGAEGRRSTLLRTTSPWQGSDGEAKLLFIARNGELPPDGFDGQRIEAGPQRLVCMSSTHVALLDAVGAAGRVVGLSGVEALWNPRLAAHRDRIGEVGYEGNIDYERLVALRPDLVLLFGLTGASTMEPKLLELGIPFVYIGEYLEESPLGKAEWMVAVAELLDLRPEGEQAFAPLPERYEALRAAAAASATPRPRIMLNAPYGDTWFMASTRSYVARLIADAGGEYVYTGNDSNRSLPVDIEEAYLLARGADIWLNAGGFASLDELRSRLPKFADLPCVRRGAVYDSDRRTNAAGGNDYWESGAVRPDIVLHDLVALFHPEVLAPDDRETVYFRRIE